LGCSDAEATQRGLDRVSALGNSATVSIEPAAQQRGFKLETADAKKHFQHLIFAASGR